MARIGITFSHHHWPDDEDNRWRMNQYVGAVEDSGGQAEPLWLPADMSLAEEQAAKLASQFDGILVSGGADLPPAMYGEEPIADCGIELITPARPQWEVALLKEFLGRGKPALGICYGCQLFNVWRGGALIQDIPAQWTDPIDHRSGRHSVCVLPHTHLHNILGVEELEVVTSHHQAISRLAEGSSTAAFAPDRLAESIEFSDETFFLGVQWHPERDRESETTQRLFGAFLKAAQGKDVWETD